MSKSTKPATLPIEKTIVVSYISTQPTILNEYPLFLHIRVLPGNTRDSRERSERPRERSERKTKFDLFFTDCVSPPPPIFFLGGGNPPPNIRSDRKPWTMWNTTRTKHHTRHAAHKHTEFALRIKVIFLLAGSSACARRGIGTSKYAIIEFM